MTVDQTVSNLFYWDGIDDNLNGLDVDDVAFVQADNALFKMISNGTFTADASDQMVTGGLIQETSFDGSIHTHPQYRVEALDATTPLAGIYLVSLQVRMEGLETSDPFFLAMGTSAIDNNALLAAYDWIETNIEMLTSPPMPAGDYNGDGLVSLADYTVWRDTLGSTTDLAANGDDTGTSQGVIDDADYAVWNDALGGTAMAMNLSSTTPIPEPAGHVAFVAAGVLALLSRCGTSLAGQVGPDGAQ